MFLCYQITKDSNKKALKSYTHEAKTIKGNNSGTPPYKHFKINENGDIFITKMKPKKS